MAVQDLNHFNIMAAQPLLDQLRDFYRDVIGLREGERPDFGVAGYWLYAGDRAIVHLIDWLRDGEPDAGSRPHLDHVAFSCTELAATEARFQAAGIDYERREIPAGGIIQLFLSDPAGVGVELNFQVD